MNNVKGNLAVSRNMAVGGSITTRGNAQIGGSLKIDGWIDAPNIKAPCKGLYADVEELYRAYPSPKPGWWALVGDNIPAQIYVSQDHRWQATGETGGGASVDLNHYDDEITRLDDRISVTDDSITDLADRIDSLTHPVEIVETKEADLIISDENGNALLTVDKGHIKTAEFDSAALGGVTIGTSTGTLQGKTFAVLGDSMSTYSGYPGCANTWYPRGDVNSASRLWWKQLESISGMTLTRVSATGAATVTPTNGCATFIDFANALYSNGTTGQAPDLILVLAGMNDWNHSNPIGSYSDSFTGDTSALIPSYRKLLSYLAARYPASQVVCLTPIPAWYGELRQQDPPIKTDGAAQADYVAAIRGCAALHGIKCIELWSALDLYSTSVIRHYIDGLHPTAATHAMMAWKIFEFLNL